MESPAGQANPDARAPVFLYEDSAIAVVVKPQGLSVHPAPGAGTETLLCQIRRHYASLGYPDRHVAAVSRLDRGTSGLILFATDRSAHPDLHRQVTQRRVRREYSLLVWGVPLFEEADIDLPVGRHWKDERRVAAYDLPARQAASWGASPARTHLEVVERYAPRTDYRRSHDGPADNHSLSGPGVVRFSPAAGFPGAALLSARLETGRMHQIRVHCQFLRLPLVGDPRYSDAAMAEQQDRWLQYGVRWQCLHSGKLQFLHPLTQEPLAFEIPPPAVFQSVRADLRRAAGLIEPILAAGLTG
jgi:23S rRNA pseudouridine1911/1915/1917 synthase